MKRNEGKKNTNLKFISLGLILAIIAGVAISCSRDQGTKAARTVKEGQVLSIADIQADPFAYTGTITITGVVAGRAAEDQSVFLMVDTTEAKVCKQTGCAKFYLPVRYSGEQPKEWDEIKVTGSFVKGKFLFTAEKADILRHLTF